MFKSFTEKLVKQDIIAPENAELYLYGLKQGFYHLVSILTIMLLGLLFGLFWQAAIFLLAYTPLRIFAGGYHAKTQLKCFVFTNVSMIAFFCACKYIVWTNLTLVIIALISSIIIFLLAPVETPNKPLEEIEVRVYKKRTRIILMVEILVLLVAIITHMQQFLLCLSLAMLVLAVMLILGKIELRINVSS